MGLFISTGYFVFVVIMLFNLQMTFFGEQALSDYYQQYEGPGLENGEFNFNQLNPDSTQPQGFVTSDGTLKPSASDALANDTSGDIFSTIKNIFWAFAESIESSGVPDPLKSFLALIVRVFTTAYTFFTALNIKNLILGGGSSQ